MLWYIINLSSCKALNPLHPGADSLPCHLPLPPTLDSGCDWGTRFIIHMGGSLLPAKLASLYLGDIPREKGPAQEVCLQIKLVLTLLLSLVTQQTQESWCSPSFSEVAFGMLWARAGLCIGHMEQNASKFCYFSNLHIFLYFLYYYSDKFVGLTGVMHSSSILGLVLDLKSRKPILLSHEWINIRTILFLFHHSRGLLLLILCSFYFWFLHASFKGNWAAEVFLLLLKSPSIILSW